MANNSKQKNRTNARQTAAAKAVQKPGRVVMITHPGSSGIAILTALLTGPTGPAKKPDTKGGDV